MTAAPRSAWRNEKARPQRNPFGARNSGGHQMASANRCPTAMRLTCANCKCTLAITSMQAHAPAERNVRQGPRGKREHAIAGCAYPFLRLMFTFAWKKNNKSAYDRFDDPCQVDGKRNRPPVNEPRDASPSGSPMLTSVPMPRGLERASASLLT